MVKKCIRTCVCARLIAFITAAIIICGMVWSIRTCAMWYTSVHILLIVNHGTVSVCEFENAAGSVKNMGVLRITQTIRDFDWWFSLATTPGYRFITIPLWLLAVLFLIIGFVIHFYEHRLLHVRVAECRSCGYSLIGLDRNGRCPECGTHTDNRPISRSR